MHYFSNLFDKVLYIIWTCPLSIISSISTLYTQSVFVLLVLLASASMVRMELSLAFIIRIYHDAQSSECQILKLYYIKNS